MDGHGVDFLLDDDWVRDLDGDFYWIWHFDFHNLFHFNDFVFGNFLVMMFVDGVDWDFHASHMMFTRKFVVLIACDTLKELNLLSAIISTTARHWDCTRCGH